eukprot:346804_1
MSLHSLTRITKLRQLSHYSKYHIQTKATKQTQELTIDLHNQSELTISAFKTLYMRHADTLDSKPILNDKLSSQYLNSFIYSPQHLPPTFPKVSSILEPYRAKLIDMNLIQWIQSRYANHILNIENKTKDTPQIINPDDSIIHKSVLHIIELGIGFDTRFERIFLSESNTNKKIDDIDYFLNEKEKVKIKEGGNDECTFDEMFNTMPSIAEMDNTISYNDYDVVCYYEIDLNPIINIRKQLIKQNNINSFIDRHNNENLFDANDSYLETQFIPKVFNNVAKKVYRQMYSYSVNDINWFDTVKKDIINNHNKHTGNQLKNFTNVCIVCESLFLYITKREMKELIEECCTTFTGAQLICDESFTNEGLMNIESEVIKANPLSYDINNKVFILKLNEVNDRLSLLVKWTIGFLVKNKYRILAIQFMKPIPYKMDNVQL